MLGSIRKIRRAIGEPFFWSIVIWVAIVAIWSQVLIWSR